MRISMTNFTQEQIEAARAAKSPEELIEMAKEAGVELTREQAEGFLSPPIGALADEELENVSGGGCGDRYDFIPAPEKWRQMAHDEGSTYSVYVPAPCPQCGASAGGEYSMYARVAVFDYPPEVFYRNAKCFACGNTYSEVDSKGNIIIP